MSQFHKTLDLGNETKCDIFTAPLLGRVPAVYRQWNACDEGRLI